MDDFEATLGIESKQMDLTPLKISINTAKTIYYLIKSFSKVDKTDKNKDNLKSAIERFLNNDEVNQRKDFAVQIKKVVGNDGNDAFQVSITPELIVLVEKSFSDCFNEYGSDIQQKKAIKTLIKSLRKGAVGELLKIRSRLYQYEKKTNPDRLIAVETEIKKVVNWILYE
jgi:hypothetical protein